MTALPQEHATLPRWQRMLLPGELRGGVDGRRSARDWVVDVAMYGVAAGLSAIVLASTWSDHGTLAIVVDLALGVVSFVALWWRRSHPVAVGVLSGSAWLLSGLAGGPALLALFNVAIRSSRRAILGIAALALASTAIFPLFYASDEAYLTEVMLGTLITGFVVGWGLFVRVQRELVLSLRERAERLEAEPRLRVEQAREAERLRIAREMHDVLAHRVSLLSLHAGALEFHPDAPAEEVAEAAAVIRASAHAALEELRDVIGVLREGAPGAAPEPPQPTLARGPRARRGVPPGGDACALAHRRARRRGGDPLGRGVGRLAPVEHLLERRPQLDDAHVLGRGGVGRGENRDQRLLGLPRELALEEKIALQRLLGPAFVGGWPALRRLVVPVDDVAAGRVDRLRMRRIGQIARPLVAAVADDGQVGVDPLWAQWQPPRGDERRLVGARVERIESLRRLVGGTDELGGRVHAPEGQLLEEELVDGLAAVARAPR